MDIYLESLKVFVSFIKEIAWPTVVIWTIYIFYQEICNLLSRLESIGGDKGASFGIQSQNPIASENTGLSSTTHDKHFTTDSPLYDIGDEIGKSIQESITKDLEHIDDKDRIPALITDIILERTALIYERVYYAIFDSQLSLLKILNASTYLSFDQAVSLYSSSKNLHTLAGYGFTNWIDYLLNNRLISKEDNKISITKNGRDFLGYIVKRNLPMDKPV